MSRGVEVEEGEEGMSWGKEVEWVSASSSELTSSPIDTDTTENTHTHTDMYIKHADAQMYQQKKQNWMEMDEVNDFHRPDSVILT